MQAAWSVRARQMESRFAFWLVLIGYNRRDRSLGHRLYLVYALIFMAIWVFAVFTLFASSGSKLLLYLNPNDPAMAAGRLAFVGFILWGFISLIRYSLKSPFLFTEDDAFLICQTPIDRRAVILTWLPADWLENALPFWAVMATLGFSLAEIGLKGQASATDIPAYVMMGVRAVVLLIPLHLGVFAFLWGIAALRLQRDEENSWLRWAAWLVTILLLGGLAIDLLNRGFFGELSAFWNWIYWLVAYPLQAAFGLYSWLNGLGVGVIWVVMGLVALFFTSKGLNLSRAAQESRIQSAQIKAVRNGSFDQASAISQKERLGLGHAPSKLLDLPGSASLLWKDGVQILRDAHFGSIFPWLKIFIAALGIILLPGWAARGLALVFLCIFVGQAGTARLRSDLSRWSIFRQLPFLPSRILFNDLALSWLVSFLVTALAFVSTVFVPSGLSPMFLFVALPAIGSVLFVAAYDILRQCPVTTLMVGASGELNARGALIAVAAVALPVGSVFWFMSGGSSLSFALLFGFVLSCALTWIAWKVAAYTLRSVE